MKEIIEIFDTVGYELSKVQLNGIFTEMEAGRKFDKKRFLKWLKKNYQFIMKKDPNVGPDIKGIVQQQMEQEKLINTLGRNNTFPIEQMKMNQFNSVRNQPQANNPLQYFKRNRKTVDYTQSTQKKKLSMKQLERNLSNWSTKMLNITRNNEYDAEFYTQDRVDRQTANKIIKFNNPIFNEKSPRNLKEDIKKDKKKKKVNLNNTIDYISKNEKSDQINITNQDIKNDKPSIQLGNVLRGSFQNASKINFNKQKSLLEQIDEDPTSKLPYQIQAQKQAKKAMNTTQHVQRKNSDSYENNDTLINNQSYQIKQESSMFNQVKPRGTFYDTFNTTFYTQTDSFYDDDPQPFNKFRKDKNSKINKIDEQQSDINSFKKRGQSLTVDYEEKGEKYTKLLQDRLQEQNLQYKNQLKVKDEISKALDMIEQNKRAKSMLNNAMLSINKDYINNNTERVRNYQEEVRRRLRDKKQYEESQMEHKVAYIASMLPSALDMHKFMKYMRRDKVFESDTGYKIVTKINTHKDKERLEYLLNYKLSST